MANTFPTTVTPSALSTFLEKLKGVGVPEKIDRTYLKQLGYSSSNHVAFIPIMKAIDLLDASGKPTERYKRGLRGGDAGRPLVADGIRSGYGALFAMYPDANARPTSDITTFIKTHSDAGDVALQRSVSTFQTLCKFGDFGSPSTAPSPVVSEDTDAEHAPSPQHVKSSSPRSDSGSVTINVNIALSVDATSDPAVYDAFFAAMAKHIKVLDGGSSNTA